MTEIRAWRGKRVCDVLIALPAAMVLAPVILFLALLVWIRTGDSGFYVHERMGYRGRRFGLIKLRTMRSGVAGPHVTCAGDARITDIGRFLRRTKLDELPQIWNVLRGDMSFVGPRPEAPQFVDLNNRLWREVLSVRPGITDDVSLLLRDEEALLAKATSRDAYANIVLPEKLKLAAASVGMSSPWRDVVIILRTLLAVFRGPPKNDFTIMVENKLTSVVIPAQAGTQCHYAGSPHARG